MKSEYNKPGNNRDGNLSSNNESNAFNNEMNSGEIGAEGGNDNGASTLRVLRKKHASGASVNKKKPIL